LSTACPGSHVSQGEPPSTPKIPLDVGEPDSTPRMEDILRYHRPTVRHIPQGARSACGKSLGLLLRNLVTSPCWDSLQRLCLFPKYTLQTPPRWGKRHRLVNPERIVDRCRAILERPPPELWSELQTDSPETRPSRKRRRPTKLDSGDPDCYDELLEAQVQALLSEGALGKAAKHLTSEGIHDASGNRRIGTGGLRPVRLGG
jgi:hypothetical protein